VKETEQAIAEEHPELERGDLFELVQEWLRAADEPVHRRVKWPVSTWESKGQDAVQLLHIRDPPVRVFGEVGCIERVESLEDLLRAFIPRPTGLPGRAVGVGAAVRCRCGRAGAVPRVRIVHVVQVVIAVGSRDLLLPHEARVEIRDCSVPVIDITPRSAGLDVTIVTRDVRCRLSRGRKAAVRTNTRKL
jgi:hypothetical protein